MVRTLISTIRQGGAVMAAINKLSPEKLILLTVRVKDKEREKSIDNVKKNFGKILNIVEVPTELYNIPAIVKDVCAVIDNEVKLKNEISIHISESRKTQALGAMFAGFIKKDKIKGVYYIEEETGKVLTLPLLNFKLSATKTQILREIARGEKRVAPIIRKTKKSKAMIYAHLKELKKDGYITDKMELTDSGKICVM